MSRFFRNETGWRAYGLGYRRTHTTVCGDRSDVDELIDWSAALAFFCIDEPPGVATRFVKASISRPLPLCAAALG